MPGLGYRLVLHDPLTLDSIACDLAPANVTTETPHLLHVMPLAKGYRHVESQGEGVGRISLRGTFGQETREYNGERRTGNETFLYFENACYKRYLHLKDVLPHYQQKQLKLEWHDWERDKHHYCEIESFTNPRDEANRMTLEFSLEVLLLGEIKPDKIVRPELDRLTKANRALADLEAQGEKLKQYGQQIVKNKDRILSLVSRAVLLPNKTVVGSLRSFVSGATAFVSLPLVTLTTLGQGIETTIASVGELATMAQADLVHELRRMKKTLYRLRRSPELFRDSVNSKMQSLQDSFYQQVGDEDTEIERRAKESGQNAEKRSLSSYLTAQAYQAGEKVRVKAGDTMRLIAKREMRDVKQWKAIVELNDLQFPYISTTGEPNTVAPGEELMIPAPAQTGSPSVSQSFGDTTIATVEDRLFGVDFRTSFDSQGKIDLIWEGNDLALVGGRKNLTQAVENRMNTKQGDLLADESYGFPDDRGTKSTQGDSLYQKFRVEKSLEVDSRVESATVKMENTGNVSKLTYSIRPVRATTGRNVEGVVSV